METQYKLAARSAQLLAKDAPQDEATRVMASMATAKSQLSKASITLIRSITSTLKLWVISITLNLHSCLCQCWMAQIICLQVRERCPSLVRECHVLLPLLEEMEKHITAFYQALERASRITSTARDPETQIQSQQKQKWQVRNDNRELTKLQWLQGQWVQIVSTTKTIYTLSLQAKLTSKNC